MPRDKFNISELREHMPKMALADPEEVTRKQKDLFIPDAPFEDTAADNKSIESVFVTKFSPGDVDDFRKILQANLPQRYQQNAKNNLGALLEKAIKEWLRINTDSECFVEPFLWSLKETDNYIGSITNGNVTPPPWIISEVGNALLRFWKKNNPDFSAVLRNVLLNWDWYQPLHLMMYVYSRLENYQDEALDMKLRKDWLHRLYYANSVIECLCAKPRTRDNIQALLQFVCTDTHQDILQQTTTFPVTKTMRENVRGYLASAEKEFFAYAEECYIAFRPNVSKKAAKSFDCLFGINTGSDQLDQIKEFVNRWAKNQQNDEELALLETQLVYNLDDEKTNTLLIQTADKLPKLTEKIAQFYSEQQLTFKTQFPLCTIAKSSANIPAYKKLIEQRYQEDGADLKNEASVQIGCAYCLTGHPELVEPLTRAVFLDGLGVQCRHIFFQITPSYANQFKFAAEKIRDDCLKDINLACRLLSNCTELFTNDPAVHTHYPIIFDVVCSFVKDECCKQLKSDGNISTAVVYGKALVNLLEKVADFTNRRNYTMMLKDIMDNQTKNPIFDLSVKEHARKLYKKLYPL